ncbi:hypothetical protein A2316_02240 [Candidatus Falkowbacteria bacterium RIFOXYB2_FULL_38_15]|uniref:Ribosome-binding factor A n=1 Tax=Candidatus Falkowbacteria bacterium RIFOXYA2_FULL_38_12 TaxID=1797993 RepID=A0A1F5S3Z8_9BACT|nr:MAG: hypothetical protein A2257_00540 [Candidatus Falkowbacteria bacterium RIFOXYA2_FULL_38_12]OGF32629.1 MAG: hypothetical protein A2316_02240 [Candidatus Falkowbacteria bacterium RIFOXYB2_FULL_38_15]OGF44563.1 MAG: hypothetical protein A2555_00790 [Candidatus Falkowbacteria bacterium RIFOXYD2_FULL_39_16]
MSLRTEQFSKLLKRELGEYFLKEIEFPNGCFATITRINVAPDLKYGEVWLSILPEKFVPVALKTISKRIHGFEKKFFKKSSSKFIPKLIFKLDTGESEAEEVERLIAQIQDESNSIK